jgi:RND family efflux transporter MFP subunit
MKNSLLTSSVTDVAAETRELPLEKKETPRVEIKSPEPHGNSKKILAIALVALIAIVWAFVHFRSTSAATSGGVRLATAARKDFVTTLRLTGTTAAVRARNVIVPTLKGSSLGTLVVTRVAHGGARVQQGEVLVEFDKQAQTKDYLDKKASYMDFVDQVEVKRAAEQAAAAADETALKQADDDLKKAVLENSKNELVSKIDAEKNQETLEEAKSTLAQLQETFKLKRQAAAADIHTLEIQRDRAKATMDYAQSNAQKMTIPSPMDGVVVLNMVWLEGRMGQVKEGDQVRAGLPFLQVVDPSDMEVRARVSETDLLKLHEGQTAQISLDAYPDLTLPAVLTELSPLGHTGQFSGKVRTFGATFSIRGSNPKLMPDLSAAADLELQTVKNATVVPLECIGREKANDFVWLKTATGFEKRAVKTGARNDLEAVIESGLNPGDQLRDPAGDAGE